MRVKITKKDGYICCPKGHTAVTFPFGEIVEGQVAKWAIQDNAGKRIMEKKKAAPENKAKANAPENK